MNNISKALILVAEYINNRDDKTCNEDSDIQILESMASILQNCNKDEIHALSVAAKELAAEEEKGNSDCQIIRDYQNWLLEIGLQ